MSSFNYHSRDGRQYYHHNSDRHYRGNHAHHPYSEASQDRDQRHKRSSNQSRHFKGKATAAHYYDGGKHEGASNQSWQRTHHSGGGDEIVHARHSPAEETRTSYRTTDLRRDSRPRVSGADSTKFHERPTNRHIPPVEASQHNLAFQETTPGEGRAEIPNISRGRDPPKRLAQHVAEEIPTAKSARHDVQAPRLSDIIEALDNDEQSSSSTDRCWKKQRPQHEEPVILSRVEGGLLAPIVEEQGPTANFGQFQSPLRVEDYPILFEAEGNNNTNDLGSIFGALDNVIFPLARKEELVNPQKSEDSTEGPNRFTLASRKYRDAGASSSKPPLQNDEARTPEDSLRPNNKEYAFVGKGESSRPRSLPEISTATVFVPSAEKLKLDRKLLDVLWSDMVGRMSVRPLHRLHSRKEGVNDVLNRMKLIFPDYDFPLKRQIAEFFSDLEAFVNSQGVSSKGVARENAGKKLQAVSQRLTEARRREGESGQTMDSLQGEMDNLTTQEIELSKKLEEVRQQIADKRVAISHKKGELQELRATIISLEEDISQSERVLTQEDNESRRLAEMEEALEKAQEEIINFNFRP